MSATPAGSGQPPVPRGSGQPSRRTRQMRALPTDDPFPPGQFWTRSGRAHPQSALRATPKNRKRSVRAASGERGERVAAGVGDYELAEVGEQ